ncbi:phosphatidylinositol-binding protein scs2 [Coemansia sp. BCRC 34490]|nr:phosphatidylinositol-binding protein scs2 [Coemansia sp. BCRC 34490]
MALVYEPEPFKVLTEDKARLTNKNNAPVAFKIKTTAPKQYCVRPNAGRIEPGNSIEIQVILQPMKEDPPADFKCRDKFLIQSIQISPEMESMPMTELWAMVEREAKSSISEKKLRVRYLPPAAADGEGGGASNSGASTPAAKEMATPASVAETLAKKTPRTSPPAARNLPGPSPLARSVETQGDDSSVNEASSAKSASPAPQQNQNQNQTQNQTQRMPEAPAAISDRLFPDSSAAQSPENTTTFAEAAAQAPSGDLQTANATISALRQQLSDCQAQLERARGSSASGSKKQPSSLASTDGLSIQSVAIIALVAFLFGYFFF